jgi:hypothetical protein
MRCCDCRNSVGVLNASATIAGTAEALQAAADVEVSSGGFRNFHYESLKGTASFNDAGLTVDSELRQNRQPCCGQRFRRGAANGAPGATIAGSSSEDGFDLHVRARRWTSGSCRASRPR